MCCSHLPSSALQILISTSSLPLLALPWRPLWIFPRQTFLRGLSAHVHHPPTPGRGGHLAPHGGVKEAARFPGLLWAGSKWLEGSGQWGQCPFSQDCQEEGRKHTGDEWFLVNFNGSGRFALLLPRTYWGAWACFSSTNPLLLPMRAPQSRNGHRSPTLLLRDSLCIFASSAYTPQVTGCPLPPQGSPDCPSFEPRLDAPTHLPDVRDPLWVRKGAERSRAWRPTSL